MKLSQLTAGQEHAAARGGRPPRRTLRLVALVVLLAAAGATAAAGAAFAGTSDTTTFLSISPTSATVGSPVTLTATVVGNSLNGGIPPEGTVSFVNAQTGVTIGPAVTLLASPGSTTNATATLTTTQLPSGTYSVNATYSGFYDFGLSPPVLWNGSTSLAVQITVGTAVTYNTQLALSADSVNVVTNHPVTFTATVSEIAGSSVPVGTVTFDDGGNGNGSPVPLGSATLNGTGVAAFTVQDFSAGTHTITATYQGAPPDNPSHATVVVTASDPVDPRVATTVTTQTSPTSITADDTVTITAHVVQTGTATPPTGDNVVIFTSSGPLGNNVLLGQSNALDANGNASLTLGGWLTGDYTITASYVGNLSSFSSSGSVALTVLPGRNPSLLTYTGATTSDFNDTTTLSARLTDPSSGLGLSGRLITIEMGSQSCSPTTDSSGNASCTIAVSQSAGTYPITASFDQDIQNNASSTSATFTVTPEQTTIASSFNRDAATTTLSATLLEDGTSPLAGRLLTFALGVQTCSGTTGATGTASCTVPTLSGHPTATLAATFAGDSQYAPAADSKTVRLQLETQVIYTGATSGDYHDPATVSARLIDRNLGTALNGRVLTFTIGSQACTGTTGADGVASCNLIVSTSPGATNVGVTYAGDYTAIGSGDTSGFNVLLEESALTATALPGASTTVLKATLLEGTTAPIANRSIVLTFGTETCTVTTDATGLASCTVPSLTGRTTAPLTASFAGDLYYLDATDTKVVTLQVPTALLYDGTTSGDYHDAAALSATLVDNHGAGLGNQTLSFSVGSQNCSATTAADGTASCEVTLRQPAGSYAVNVSFSGNGPLLASSSSSSLTVTPEQTTIVSGLNPLVWNTSTIALSAFLFEDGTTPIENRLVTLTLGTSSCTTHTNLIGAAVCSVDAQSTLGPATATVSFAGDAYYAAASASKPVLVYSFAPGGGSFVIGDRSTTGSVDFWGSQWWKRNSLSGGSAPQSFKGFALDTSIASCGSGWATDPGNSSPPPAGPLPSYMGVIVTRSSSKSGSKISGSIAHIVVVKTHAGYDGNPGHDGTGTVVATVC